MRDALRALSSEYDMLPAGERVLCAVSGGADSMCLLHLLHTLAQQEGFTLQAAHFNHKLRGEESERDEAFVRARCLEWGIPLTCGSAPVARRAEESGRGIEETARVLRYEFLERTAEGVGAGRIATAHTADDNAETMLLNLVRGAGLQGLSGIPPRRGKIVRPLLNVTRTQVEAYCAAHGVPWVEDSTNSDEGYTRNFLRSQVMPRLKQVNPRAVENLSAAAGRLRSDHACLNELAQRKLEELCPGQDGQKVVLKATELAPLAEPIAARVLRLAAQQAGCRRDLGAVHVSALLKLCRSGDPSGRIMLPGLLARREYDRLVLEQLTQPPPPSDPVLLREEGETVYGNTGWHVFVQKAVGPDEIRKNPHTFFLSRAKLEGQLVLRPRQAGDAIRLPGRGAKSLKKLLIESKVPLTQREFLPVLADAAGVVAVAGFGPDEARLARPGEDALKITMRKSEEYELL